MEMHNNIRDFRNLKVWQKSMSLQIKIYKVIGQFPESEKFVLTSQLLRATNSISANIAEGNGQLYVKNEIRFLNTAIGSASECRNHIFLAHELNYINDAIFKSLDLEYESIIKMLFGMLKHINSRN